MRYVLYHHHCLDGFGAAYAAWKKFGTDNTKYISVIYSKPPPEMPDADEVYIVDFSFPREVLLDLRTKIESVFIIDHHESAQRALENLPDCIFDMKKSGAVLSWEYFHPNTPVPELLLYIQDRDLWHKKLPQTEEVFYALVSYPYEFAIWDQFNIEALKVEGKGILRKNNLDVEMLAKKARFINIAGHKVLAVNTPVMQSEVANKILCDRSDVSIAACYSDTTEGYLNFSLRARSNEETNVSKICELFGGGGHKSAAGFTIKSTDERISPILEAYLKAKETTEKR